MVLFLPFLSFFIFGPRYLRFDYIYPIFKIIRFIIRIVWQNGKLLSRIWSYCSQPSAIHFLHPMLKVLYLKVSNKTIEKRKSVQRARTRRRHNRVIPSEFNSEVGFPSVPVASLIYYRSANAFETAFLFLIPSKSGVKRRVAKECCYINISRSS